MGSITVNPLTVTFSGATATNSDTGASTSSIVISPTTAQGALNLSKLVVVFENYSTTASFTISLDAGTLYSAIGQGATTAITCATAGTAGFIKAFGGHDFESARFLNATGGTISFTITTAATAYVKAYQIP